MRRPSSTKAVLARPTRAVKIGTRVPSARDTGRRTVDPSSRQRGARVGGMMGTHELTAPVISARATSTASELMVAMTGVVAAAVASVVIGLRLANDGPE